MPPQPLTNFEIEEYHVNEPRFNDFYSRGNLPKTTKNGAYMINLDDKVDVGTHWVVSYVTNNEVIYFDSFGVEHFPKDKVMHPAIEHKNIKTNIF